MIWLPSTITFLLKLAFSVNLLSIFTEKSIFWKLDAAKTFFKYSFSEDNFSFKLIFWDLSNKALLSSSLDLNV